MKRWAANGFYGTAPADAIEAYVTSPVPTDTEIRVLFGITRCPCDCDCTEWTDGQLCQMCEAGRHFYDEECR